MINNGENPTFLTASYRLQFAFEVAAIAVDDVTLRSQLSAATQLLCIYPCAAGGSVIFLAITEPI